MSNYVEVDSRVVERVFAQLTGKEMQKARTNAIKQSAGILVKQTQKNFKAVTRKWNSPNRWNGKKLIQGIKASVQRDKETVKVHIMGDFRLKFFELGTKDRETRKTYKNGKKKYTGKMPKMGGFYFFQNAQKQAEPQCFSEMEKMLNISIQKIANNK